MQKATLSLAVAKVISMDVAVVAVLSEMNGIFKFKEEWLCRRDNLFLFHS